jgi:2,4-diaminopentanoate dehydrogenase
MPIRVLHVGLGPIGAGVVRQVAARNGFKIAGAVDVDPAKVGARSRRRRRSRARLRVRVTPDLRAALKATSPDVVALCTSSSLAAIVPQLETILKARRPVVSTTEELAYPFYTHKRLAGQIDAMARKAKVAVLGTGVNPGFAMDALPDHADGRVRARGADHGQARAGRPHPAAAVPAEDRLGAGPGARSTRRCGRGPCATSA